MFIVFYNIDVQKQTNKQKESHHLKCTTLFPIIRLSMFE